MTHHAPFPPRHLLFLATLMLLTAALSRAAELAPAAPVAPAAAHHTFVIVHGAWGGGWAFREVDRLLTADGHKVYRPTLTGQGEKVHLATRDTNLTTHVTDIVNVILFEDLHDVVLVGHSYGGMVITGVMDRVPQPLKTWTEAVSFKNPLAHKLPGTVVVFVGKNQTPEQLKDHPNFVRARARGWGTLTLESDHNAQWSHPKELAALLEGIAAGRTRDR